MNKPNQQPEKSNDKGQSAGERLRRILSGNAAPRQEISGVEHTPPIDGWEAPDSNPKQMNPADNHDTQPIVVEDSQASEETLEASDFKEVFHEITGHITSVWNRLKGKLRGGGSDGSPPRPPRKGNLFSYAKNNPRGCLLYSLVGIVLIGIIITIISLSFLIFQYFWIAADLPGVDNLRAYASQFETTRIYDRNDNLIYEIVDPNAGRRTYVTLEDISPYLVAATIATEDKDFYSNPGFDPWAIIRALWQNYTSGKVVSGASTITQQLARTLLLSPEERVEVSTQRKAREIVLAAEITRKYSKDEILELYLNENNYGNYSYGIQAAAESYFGTSADQLNLAQASFLAGIPQAPAYHDIFANRDETLIRHKDVLNLMYRLSQERDCISVHHASLPICVTLDEAVAAAQEIEAYAFEPSQIQMPFPHWVNYIRGQLESQFDPQTIYRSGFKVFTTLDPQLQRFAQDVIENQLALLVENEATNGALVAIRPSTGEVLSMVGSADFFNESISGQVNMAVSPRQPGSSIKPLTYAAALEKGWTPSTLIWDVPSEFPPSGNPDDTREPYKPVNYDGKFHGPTKLRYALANSYNIPAVKTLDYVGIYDNPDTPEEEGLIKFAERMGISTLVRDDYGLSLTLGGGDVSLLELTNAFAIFAKSGKSVRPYAIEKIENYLGEVVYEYAPDCDTQIIRSEFAFLISDILSDNSARTPAFGANSVLHLPFPAAVKTGTTNDFRDNWTVGYTPDIAVGVWVGNADYTPMKNISGVTGAAPVWNEVMQWAVDTYFNGAPELFARPGGIADMVVCAESGTKPSENCPNQTSEIFAADRPPLDADHDLWIETAIDTWTKLKASSACSEFTEQELTLNVQEKWAVKWIKDTSDGKAWAEKMGFSEPVLFTPEEECSGDDLHPKLVFVGLSDDMEITTSPLDIYVVADVDEGFERLQLQYGIGNNPSKWTTLADRTDRYDQPEKLSSWDVYEAESTRITLRLLMEGMDGAKAEKRIHLNLFVPTLTPNPTSLPTETPVPLPTATSTETVTQPPGESPTPAVPPTNTQDTDASDTPSP